MYILENLSNSYKTAQDFQLFKFRWHRLFTDIRHFKSTLESLLANLGKLERSREESHAPSFLAMFKACKWQINVSGDSCQVSFLEIFYAVQS